MSQLSDLLLVQRIFKSSHQPCVQLPLAPHVTTRPEVYKQWNDKKMTRAMKAVNEEGISVRRAVSEFNVPRKTLNDRINGKVVHGTLSGRSRYLNYIEEEELVRFLLQSSSIGYARTRSEVIALVQRICFGKGLDVFVTHEWWEGFCHRHPSIVLCTPAHLSIARAKATDSEVFSHYFDLLESTLCEYDLLDKPSQLFNMDKTGVPLNPDLPKGIFKRGNKNLVSVSSGDKS